MAGYIGRAIERHGLPVCSSVLYLRPNAGRRDPGHHFQERPGHRILFEYKVIRLIELDGQRILEGGHAGLIPFAPLMKPPAGLESAEWLSQFLRESSFAQYLTQQAREEGIEQGLRESIRDVLEVRFGLGAADALTALVAAIGDAQRLKQLLRQAIQVASLEEFRNLVEAAEQEGG